MSEIEFVLSELFQHQVWHSVMLFHSFCEDQDVVQVHTDHTFCDEILEDIIHHGLEGGWAVSETEEHHQRFKESSVGAECSLPFITFLDVNIVVSPADIKLGEVTCTPEAIDEIGNEWKWIDILDCLCIQCPIVLEQLERPILLRNKEYQCCHGGLGGADPTQCQILFNEDVQFSLLIWREWVDLSG
jgi:hypothetical protein